MYGYSVMKGTNLGRQASPQNHWTANLGETSATPSIWADAIAPILPQGRQARVFGEWMFQDLTDRAMGGQSLTFAFSAFCAAGFMPNHLSVRLEACRGVSRRSWAYTSLSAGTSESGLRGFMDDERLAPTITL